MGIKSLEDLNIWKKGMDLVDAIYDLTNKEPLRKDFALKEQIRRAVISVPSNIAEGFERGSNTEFIQFLFIAKGSCGEVKTQLHIMFNRNYINKTEFDATIKLASEISAMIKRLINYLSKSSIKGEKYRYKSNQ
ncbi:MAG: four helix bundle protein [Planctomycetota bacterium]|nr:four helix bundle protein [Planctomycetota bacterium]MDI6787727.1 four helix bundle protein [Planctomycetota bacterium]